MDAAARRLAVTVAAIILSACSAENPSAPQGSSLRGAAGGSASFDAQSFVDVSGTWNWSELAFLRLPPEVASGAFGIVPEGPLTHATCVDVGVITLAQSGATFTGNVTQLAQCETTRGQTFDPIGPFPAQLPLDDGLLVGRSFSFELYAGNGIICTYRGAVTVQNDVAVSMQGVGACQVPGLSGISQSVEFKATRT